MAAKSKAGGAKKQKPQHRKDEKPQSERFLDAAREFGVDETGAEFERLFAKVVRPIRPAQELPKHDQKRKSARGKAG